MIDGTAILAGGVGPPLVRVSGAGGREAADLPRRRRAHVPGPVFYCDLTESAARRARPLAIRADGSALGRLQGPGIASIISSTDVKAPPPRQLEWGGDFNLFAGWKGFFARGPLGPETRIVVDDLAQARSTWNATEQGSQWIFSDWFFSGDPARRRAAEFARFLPGPNALMAGPARPGVGLFPKTFDAYADPIIPEPTATLAVQPAGPAVPGPQRQRPRCGRGTTGPESRRCRCRARPRPRGRRAGGETDNPRLPR